jgi:hypothetical protein
VQRLGVEGGRWPLLHQGAQVHHPDHVGHVAHHPQVVGDEQVGEAQALLQGAEQVEHLGLHGHVQRAHRLVADQQGGVERQGAGDHHPLTLPAGELVLVAGRVPGRQPDLGEQLGGAGVALQGRADAVDPQGLLHDAPRAHAGGQGAGRVLGDKLHLPPPRLERTAVQRMGVAAAEQHPAGGGRLQRQDQAGEGGLAAAGLTEQPEGGALFDLQGDVVDRADGAHHPAQRAAAHRVVLAEVLNAQQAAQPSPPCTGGTRP